ncbi:MAG: TIGR04282 family arsenosugar biosynthesis glycosyltransferase [Calditrichia bacterium]
MNNPDALILFLKAPIAGEVKTRLQPELTPDEALNLYKAMVEDLLERLQKSKFFELILCFTPAYAEKSLKDWLGGGFQYLAQTGDDLGQRLHHSFRWSFSQNFSRAGAIGSDIPRLRLSDIEKAFSQLKENEVVVGPCLDGGYYLIGLDKPRPALFRGINWSTHQVFAQTMAKIREEALTVSQLDPLPDVDIYRDVLDLWHFLGESEPTLTGEHERTYKILNELFRQRVEKTNAD